MEVFVVTYVWASGRRVGRMWQDWLRMGMEEHSGKGMGRGGYDGG